MVDEADRASRTLDDLMELSRIQVGGEPAREPVEVADVVGGGGRSRQLAKQRAIAIAVLEPPAGGRVIGDRRQLVSALGNLVENAVKYSEPGSQVQVRVRLEGPSVEIMVVDQGSASARTSTASSSASTESTCPRPRHGGTGFGLSIVRHVAPTTVVRCSSPRSKGRQHLCTATPGEPLHESSPPQRRPPQK